MRPDERPRERCLKAGASALSLRECLALLLGSGPPGQGALGLAERILSVSGPGLDPAEEERAFYTALESSGHPHWNEKAPGLGPASLARLLAAFELARRYSDYRLASVSRHPAGTFGSLSARALKQIPESLRMRPREWLGFIPYHRNRELGRLCIVEEGARTHVNADAAELFARVLALRPRGFFLVHNHPSGDLRPSPTDLELTFQVDRLASQLSTPLLGHWIVAPSGEVELPAGRLSSP
jgi:DNA repair protein RadC